MAIYTKKGDRGQTGIFDGTRVAKNAVVVEAIGAIDELNAAIGAMSLAKKLEGVQRDLFSLGSKLAGYETEVDWESRVAEMEGEIDRMWGKLPPLKNFILPRGEVHLVRAVCRRAERAVVAANAAFAFQYLNRLSDYLFCLARWVNFQKKKKEVLWKR